MSVDRKQNVILLGASNLAIGFPLVYENLRHGFEAPIRVFTAKGHGRSYGQWSHFFWRGLPGIVECGIWDALDQSDDDRSKRSLLLTDIGNDLAYGVEVPQILDWVQACLDRVAAEPSRTVLTLPPLESILRISRWQYGIMRTVIFPGCRVSLAAMRDAAVALTEQLAAIGDNRGLSVVPPAADWYGFDPIHIRRGCRSKAWRSILSRWPDFDVSNWVADVPYSRKIDRQSQIPALQTMFGRVQSLANPETKPGDVALSAY